MKQGILQADGLCKSYGRKAVLENLSLTLQPGKIYGLVGRNGAGKTTLLGCLTGQNPFQKGSVTYDGAPVWENQAALEHICFSRELPTTLMGSRNNLKIQHYLDAASLFYPNWDKEYAARLLELFHLEKKSKIYALSQGQRSMVTILIALASRAPLTILDEPAAGLDVVAREQFYRLLLDDFAHTERTFVISTHIIEEAASVFEEVLFLDEGKIVECGPVEELLEQFHAVSGRAEEVDRACQGVTVLSARTIGRRKEAVIWGVPAPDADVDFSPLGLQQIFVALCGHGAEQI